MRMNRRPPEPALAKKPQGAAQPEPEFSSGGVRGGSPMSLTVAFQQRALRGRSSTVNRRPVSRVPVGAAAGWRCVSSGGSRESAVSGAVERHDLRVFVGV